MTDDLAVLLLGFLHQIGDVDKKLAIEMRAAGAVEPEKIMPRSGRRFGGRACGNVLHGNVVDRDRDLVLLAPVLGELVEPRVVLRNEVAHCTIESDLLAARRSTRRRGEHRRRAGGGKGEARVL